MIRVWVWLSTESTGPARPGTAGASPVHPFHFISMLSEKEIDHIAELARIAITADERRRFQKELSVILEYVHQLDTVSTEGVEPLYQVTGLRNATRPDAAPGAPDHERAQRIVDQAPHTQERFVKVPSVLKKQ